MMIIIIIIIRRIIIITTTIIIITTTTIMNCFLFSESMQTFHTKDIYKVANHLWHSNPAETIHISISSAYYPK